MAFRSAMPTEVLADSGPVRRTLLNLIGNAVKFNTEGEVVVEAASKVDRWALSAA